MKTKKRLRSITAITLLLCVFASVLWAAAMFCITNAVAQNYYELLLQDSYNFADYATTAGWLDMLYSDDHVNEYMQSTPGYKERCMLDTLRYTNARNLASAGWENDSLNVLRDETIPMQTAVVFLDGDGKLLFDSGDYIYFQYVTQDVWQDEREEQETSGNAWIDLSVSGGDSDPYAFFRTMYSGVRSIRDIRVIRITGHMDGAEIKPVKMEYVTDTMIYQALDETEPDIYEVYADGTEHIGYVYTVSGLDHTGLFEWETVFDNSATAENRDELVTVYAMYPEMNVYDAGDPVTFQGESCEDLLTLLSTTGYGLFAVAGGQIYASNEYRLDEIIILEARYFRDLRGYDFGSDEPMPELEFVMLTAVSSDPLGAAVKNLVYVYIVTLLFAAICVLVLRRIIKRNLTEPLEEVSEGIQNGWTHISSLADAPPAWREVDELRGHYSRTQDKLRVDKNELTRLNTALEYARTAEQNRRQMTSNIAHEMKTPLAVIHSYSEGLKEHIAEEKREHYLDVILSESEYMDSMIQEMLDLSRLEAGRVKLSRDDFSISALAASIFEKLGIAAEEKSLNISFDLKGECMVAADEARIGQVITNFATNAIKYTPEGGSIFVSAFTNYEGTWFTIANDSDPLTGEELSKVWETFYRTDGSRTGEGAGLGLAIAKSIIDLHGGKCTVRNTESGVEFGFCLT